MKDRVLTNKVFRSIRLCRFSSLAVSCGMLWIEKFQVYSMDLDGYLLYAETFRAVFWALLLLLARDAGFFFHFGPHTIFM